MEKIWTIKDSDAYFPSQKTMRITRKLPPRVEKDPATAYTFPCFSGERGRIFICLQAILQQNHF